MILDEVPKGYVRMWPKSNYSLAHAKRRAERFERLTGIGCIIVIDGSAKVYSRLRRVRWKRRL